MIIRFLTASQLSESTNPLKTFSYSSISDYLQALKILNDILNW
jgi:hypothetical protein